MRTYMIMSILSGVFSTNLFAAPTPNLIQCKSLKGEFTVTYDAVADVLGKPNRTLTLEAAKTAQLQDLTGEVSVVENDVNIGTQYTVIINGFNATDAITLVVPSGAPISKAGETQPFDGLLVWKTSFNTPGSLADFKYIALSCIGFEALSI